MTQPEIEALRAFNIAFHDAGLGNALYHRLMHFGAWHTCASAHRRPTRRASRRRNGHWIGVARSRARWSSGSGASGVRVVGDLARLMVPRGGAEDGRSTVCIPSAVAASMATGVAVATGAARGGFLERIPLHARAVQRRQGAIEPGRTRSGALSRPGWPVAGYQLAGVDGDAARRVGLTRTRRRASPSEPKEGVRSCDRRPPKGARALDAFDAWLTAAGLPEAAALRLQAAAAMASRKARRETRTASHPRRQRASRSGSCEATAWFARPARRWAALPPSPVRLGPRPPGWPWSRARSSSESRSERLARAGE